MKTTLLSSLLALVVLFLMTEELTAQRWIGLHNLNYRNSSESFSQTSISPAGDEILTTDTFYEKAVSTGVHYRLLGAKNSYQQFELLYSRQVTGETTRVEILGNPILEPTRGEELTRQRISIGYRRGKLYELKNRLRGDLGAGVVAGWAKEETLPLTSAGFPVHQNGLRFTLNTYAGLNYQLHTRVNISYDIVPVAFDIFAYEQTVENPLLTDGQKRGSGMDLDIVTFPNVIGWQNFRISYVLK